MPIRRRGDVVAALGHRGAQPEAGPGRGWWRRSRSPRAASAGRSARFRPAEAARSRARPRPTLTADHGRHRPAHPGGHRRCRPRRAAALPPARRRRRRVGRASRPARRSTSRPGSAPASSSSPRSTCSRECGLGDRLDREGDQHRGIYLQWPDERHHLDFVDLTGRSVWVYGQTEVQKDLVAARTAAGQEIHYEVTDTALHDLETDHPSVTFTDVDGRERRLDGRRRGRLRRVVRPEPGRGAARRTPAVGEGLPVLLARHPRRRRAVHRRADLRLAPRRLRAALDAFGARSPASTSRCPNGTDVDDWSDDRIWEALATRLGHGQDGWELTPGPDHRQERAADALVRADADAARPAVPGRRRRPHRAADRRQGAQPRGRRRRAAGAGPGRAGAARTTTGWPTPTPTRRCAGSGGAPTSRGG